MAKTKALMQKTIRALSATAFIFLTRINMVAASLWDGTGSESFISNFSAFYQKWFILVLGVSLACYFFLRDEKMKGYARNCVIGSVVVYLLTWEPVQTFAINTFSAIPEWFN